jgi:hypothetical protein
MKVALLITIILFNTLQITFGALSLPFIYRHSGYGRRGAWARPWNEDRVPASRSSMCVSRFSHVHPSIWQHSPGRNIDPNLRWPWPLGVASAARLLLPRCRLGRGLYFVLFQLAFFGRYG